MLHFIRSSAHGFTSETSHTPERRRSAVAGVLRNMSMFEAKPSQEDNVMIRMNWCMINTILCRTVSPRCVKLWFLNILCVCAESKHRNVVSLTSGYNVMLADDISPTPIRYHRQRRWQCIGVILHSCVQVCQMLYCSSSEVTSHVRQSSPYCVATLYSCTLLWQRS